MGRIPCGLIFGGLIFGRHTNWPRRAPSRRPPCACIVSETLVSARAPLDRAAPTSRPVLLLRSVWSQSLALPACHCKIECLQLETSKTGGLLATRIRVCPPGCDVTAGRQAETREVGSQLAIPHASRASGECTEDSLAWLDYR